MINIGWLPEKDAAPQEININMGRGGYPTRPHWTDAAVAVFVVVIGLGVAVALVAGAIW